MRIVLDMQPIQVVSDLSGAEGSGIAFAKALVRARGDHEVILVLSSLFPETIERYRAEFYDLLPQQNIRVWQAPRLLHKASPANHERQRHVRELLREAFISSLQPDIVHVVTPIDQAFERASSATRVSNTLTRKVLLETKDIEETAKTVLSHWADFLGNDRVAAPRVRAETSKPRLIYVSPLPPERTGIADYSSELLPFLAQYYDIELVVAKKENVSFRLDSKRPVRDSQWFRENVESSDRIVYHLGNYHYHSYMLPLIQDFSGIVVLHDFYLGHLMAWMEASCEPNAWMRELYRAHGYSAVKARSQEKDIERAILAYPVGRSVLQHASGVIVHSNHARSLAERWYGPHFSEDWSVIPHLRVVADRNRAEARARLGFKSDQFVVCSFGFLGPAKLNQRVVQAWLRSALGRSESCSLIFVGEPSTDAYGIDLIRMIKNSGCEGRIRITGYAAPELYAQYLAATDLAVQLRARDRGESSGTVLDCMGQGLPLIVNAHGAMAELPTDSVWMLPNQFEDADLINALEQFWQRPEARNLLGASAKKHILERHAPQACAKQYFETIEAFWARSHTSVPNLLRALSECLEGPVPKGYLADLAGAIALNHPLPRRTRTLYLDLTATVLKDLRTGISRVARAQTLALINSSSQGFRIEPVHLSFENGAWVYRHATQFVLGLLKTEASGLENDLAEPVAGDIILGLDVSGDILVEAESQGLHQGYRDRGVHVFFLVHDLLPIRMPEVFPPGADRSHERWLKSVSNFDGAICVSREVARDLIQWQREEKISHAARRSYQVRWCHHGADIKNSAPTLGFPSAAAQDLPKIESRPSMLMVGTVEPRKGYLQVLEAFDRLWKDNVDINLVIVGREGWDHLASQADRRNIPETVKRLREHPERNRRLFWLEGISDEYLDAVYSASTCLIAASYGEGFGLPLIEAAQKGLPVIARDIPVFREVAGDGAYFFDDDRDPQVIENAVKHWLDLYRAGAQPSPASMHWLTWEESARQLELTLEEMTTFEAHNKPAAMVNSLSE